MAKRIDKIIQSKTAPKSNNVLWDDGENLKINRNGKWENANNAETNNLSIDPVVWKYMCEPYVIDPNINGTISKDLIPIIFDNDGILRDIVYKLIVCVNGTFKSRNPNENTLYGPQDEVIYIKTDGTWESI